MTEREKPDIVAKDTPPSRGMRETIEPPERGGGVAVKEKTKTETEKAITPEELEKLMAEKPETKPATKETTKPETQAPSLPRTGTEVGVFPGELISYPSTEGQREF